MNAFVRLQTSSQPDRYEQWGRGDGSPIIVNIFSVFRLL